MTTQMHNSALPPQAPHAGPRWYRPVGLALIAVGVVAWTARSLPTTRQHASPTLQLLDPNGPAISTAFAIGKLMPGETTSRVIDLRVAGPVILTTRAKRSSLLDTDRHDGLQMRLDICTSQWIVIASRRVYRCDGTVSAVVSNAPIIQTAIDLSHVGTIRTMHLLVQVTLPTTANNRFQGLSSSIEWTFTPE